jgi:Transposase IS66 family
LELITLDNRPLGAVHRSSSRLCGPRTYPVGLPIWGIRVDWIFQRQTGFVVLDRLLARLHANKPELLRVLDRPEIPLHTNGSENDIRAQVTRRKVSGGTRSDTGRDCRDAFLGLAKTCAKLGLSFWDYLGARLDVPDQPAIPYLPDLVRNRCSPA